MTGPGAQYHVYETPAGCRSVDIFPPGTDPNSQYYSPFTRCTSPSVPVSTYGNPGASPFTMDIQGVGAAVYPYPSPAAYLTVMLSSYPTGSIIISPQSVNPPSATGIFLSQCASVLLYDTPMASSFSLTGVRCPTTIQSSVLTNFTFSGNQEDFGGRMVTITESVYTLTVSVPAETYVVTSAAIAGDSNLLISMPAATSNIVLVGSSTPTNFSIQEVSPYTTLTVNGGPQASEFTISEIGTIHGRLILNGGVQMSLLNSLTMSIRAEDGPTVICTQTTMVQTGGAAPFSITYSNMGFRNLTFYGAPSRHLVHTLVTPEPGASIDIWSKGVEGGAVTHQVTGCGAGALVRIDLSGAGEQTVTIGQNGDLSAVQCNIWAHGSTGVAQTVTIVIDASTDSRALLFTFTTGNLVVSNPASPANFFSVQFSNIAQFVVSYGNGMTAVMAALVHTEYLFMFPPAPTAPCSVVIDALPNAMFVNGSATITYNAQKSGNTPFDNVQGMVVAGGGGKINVVLTSALGVVPNFYYADTSCVGILDSNYNAVPPSASPSPWYEKQKRKLTLIAHDFYFLYSMQCSHPNLRHKSQKTGFFSCCPRDKCMIKG